LFVCLIPARSMAQVVKCLPSEHEDLSSNSSSTKLIN
jgi:hypothetical protein